MPASLSLLLFPTLAFAGPMILPTTQAENQTAPADPATPAPLGVNPARKPRAPMEFNFRGRMMGVPKSILDSFYFDSDDAGANPFERPRLRMYVFGLEYVWKPGPMNMIFYYEYIGSGIKEGYWDDLEQPANHDDGDWLKPSNFGVHAFGANYAYEIPISDETRNVWVSMLFSAGLGVGIVSGELSVWHPGGNPTIQNTCLRDAPAFERKNSCVADGEVKLPGIIPIVDLTMSSRINFGERANARLDLGIHDMFYVGTAVGATF
jgi:hypothetical protein